MPDFGIMRGFNEKLFGDKLVAGQLPTQLGLIGSTSLIFPILDLYPGAAAAYSLRLLRTLYTGYAIRVRRSSDNAESDIGFSGENLDTSALNTFCTGTNGFVTTWYDQSGNARNATQTTAVNQPQIVSSGAIINLNSKPTVQFNNQQFISRASFNVTSVSTFTVLKKYTVSNYGGYMRNVTSSGQSFAILSSSPSLWNTQCVNFTNGTDVNPNPTSRLATKTLPTNQYLENWIYNATVRNLYENNSNITTGLGETGWPGIANFTLGSVDYGGFATNSKNEIQEFIIYDADQSTNSSAINTNINTYYAIY